MRGCGCVGGGGIKLPIAVTGMSLGRIGCCPTTRSAARLTLPSLGPETAAASSKPLLRNSLSNLEGLLLTAAAAEAAEVDLTTGTGSLRTPLPASRTVSRLAPAARGSSPSGERIGLKFECPVPRITRNIFSVGSRKILIPYLKHDIQSSHGVPE